MIETMLKTIEQHQLIEKGERIVVGLSGGPDSLALMHALIHQKRNFMIDVVAVHINHMFRGLDANDDEAFVVNFCRSHEVPCYTFRIDVEALALQLGISFEEAGRKVRYEKFQEVLAITESHKIAVAQNKNDLIETFFINLFRGAGIEGLSSIEYMRNKTIIRPLLDVDRNTIEQYCEANHLNPRIDITNATNDYVRNRIRNEMIPYVEKHFNPSIGDAVYKTISVMKDEKDFWKKHTENLFERFGELSTDISPVIKLKGSAFSELQSAEIHQLIRLCLMKVKGSLKHVSYEDVLRIKSIQRTGAVIELQDQIFIEKSYDQIIFYKNALHKQSAEIENHPLTLHSAEKIQLHVKVVPKDQLRRFVTNDVCVAVDADVIKGPLRYRYRIPGDAFIPLGMRGKKKIKEFFIDEKVPKDIRDHVLLVHDDEKIIWVHKMRISDVCKITEYTKNVIVMSFQELVENH